MVIFLDRCVVLGVVLGVVLDFADILFSALHIDLSRNINTFKLNGFPHSTRSLENVFIKVIFLEDNGVYKNYLRCYGEIVSIINNVMCN